MARRCCRAAPNRCSASRPTRRRSNTRGCATPARTCGSSAGWSRPTARRRSFDAVVFLQTIEHVHDPVAVLRHFARLLAPGGCVYVSTPNLLTIAPPGAAKSSNPWHIKEYRAHEFDALCRTVFGDVELLGLVHARRLRAHELALRLGWDARPLTAASDQAVLRPLHAGDRRLGLQVAALRARPGAGLPRRLPVAAAPELRERRRAGEPCGPWRALNVSPMRALQLVSRDGAGRTRDRPAHPHAVHGGRRRLAGRARRVPALAGWLRHLAVRRGAAVRGGRELLRAAARRARPAPRRR